jgi:hypothetical protein
MSRAQRAVRLMAAAAACVAIAGCGGVTIHPEPKLPAPLVQPLQTDVGLIIPDDQRNYTHKETRWGVDWQIALGAGHVHSMEDVFKDEFTHVQEFKDLQSARAASNLKALFEPRIDQYSFVTARETGGRYYAVTIRYRILMYTPQGEQADTFTLTGYGNALAKGMTSSAPLMYATVAAMRDAAAKFLVQFPEQAPGQQLARNQPVTSEKAQSAVETALIDAVPIDEPGPELANTPQTPTPAPVTPAPDTAGPPPGANPPPPPVPNAPDAGSNAPKSFSFE